MTVRRTWRGVFIAALVCIVAVYASRRVWLEAIGEGLVCESSKPTVNAIVIDNFDHDYWLFRASADLQRHSGMMVFVPIPAYENGELALAANEIANAFARVARLSDWEIIPIRQQEPISLNTAYQVRDFLKKRGVSSVTLISYSFRSKRSNVVYRSVLGGSGIAVSCLPVPDTLTPETWTHSWHGIQEVGLQFMKLQYYRFWVVPFHKEQR